MKRFIAVLIISSLVIITLPFIDYLLNQGDLFGLWTGIFGPFVGVTLILIGLSFVFFSFFFLVIRKKDTAKNITLNGLSLVSIGLLTMLATIIFWFVLGQPFFP